MPEATAGGRLIHETTSLCRTCKNALPARVEADAAGEVWLRKRCPDHGSQQARLSTDAAWYERTRAANPAPNPPRQGLRPVEDGCPFDCGPCELHEQTVKLPVVTITSQCDLDCPICYVHNKNEGAYHMTPDELRGIVDHLVAEQGGELDLINLTGGEPTLHPHFLEFIQVAREAGVHRVSFCTNGIRLVKEPHLAERLAGLGGRVALSFDSFEREADYALQGAHLVDLKLQCLDLLERLQIDTTLIPVATKGFNDHELGRIVELGLARSNVRHVEVHTITYTGQGGVSFDPERTGRISMVEVLDRIEAQTEGLLRRDDFVPSPCAHPLCYQIAYLLLDPEGGRPISFTRFMSREDLYACLGDHLYLEPSPRLETTLQAAINELWTADDDESQRTLRILDRLLRTMFPSDKPISREAALRVSELASKAVYVHSHMDEDTFDVERAMQCCDSNCYPDGVTIPVCNSNVLFRERNPKFISQPLPWHEREGGRRDALPARPGRLLPTVR
jgi:uncharacterized radical SAM superfamily Fe-S cluster-containing enzyme